MICLRCDNQEFVDKPDAVIEQQFRGETLHVQTPALACTQCGWLTVDATRTDELRRRTADAYRRKHGLLTSDAIKAFREVLDMNQREFAAFLGVGESSVKRWETWLVQEKSSDELIRMKCREVMTQKPQTIAWFYGYHHGTVEEAPNGVVIQTQVVQETPKPSRWSLDVELAAQENEIEMLSHSNQPSVCGLSPPPCDESRIFSFSAPGPQPRRR
jgi:putative zinc finger/helix-turn-helix YgiT family protein